MTIRSVGAELFHADRRTDMTKLVVAFRNFSNARKKIKIISTEHMDKCDSSRWCYNIKWTYEPKLDLYLVGTQHACCVPTKY